VLLLLLLLLRVAAAVCCWASARQCFVWVRAQRPLQLLLALLMQVAVRLMSAAAFHSLTF
jgi:hypothetical protein